MFGRYVKRGQNLEVEADTKAKFKGAEQNIIFYSKTYAVKTLRNR